MHSLPDEYVAKLKAIETNGIFDVEMLKNIEKNKKEAREPEPIVP